MMMVKVMSDALRLYGLIRRAGSDNIINARRVSSKNQGEGNWSITYWYTLAKSRYFRTPANPSPSRSRLERQKSDTGFANTKQVTSQSMYHRRINMSIQDISLFFEFLNLLRLIWLQRSQNEGHYEEIFLSGKSSAEIPNSGLQLGFWITFENVRRDNGDSKVGSMTFRHCHRACGVRFGHTGLSCLSRQSYFPAKSMCALSILILNNFA